MQTNYTTPQYSLSSICLSWVPVGPCFWKTASRPSYDHTVPLPTLWSLLASLLHALLEECSFLLLPKIISYCLCFFLVFLYVRPSCSRKSVHIVISPLTMFPRVTVSVPKQTGSILTFRVHICLSLTYLGLKDLKWYQNALLRTEDK